MAMCALEVDAIPSVDVDAAPVDANVLAFNQDVHQPVHKLNSILNKLTIPDYRSMFFMLIGIKFKKEDFLFWVMQERIILRNKFLNIYYEFRFKDALLIEIFGTMQRYDLLKSLGTCCHVFEKDKDTFTQLNSLWKHLYAVCEQLTDGEIYYLKENLFPEDTHINVCCAEELVCLAFLKGKLEEGNWKTKLEDILKSFLPNCSKLITPYKGSKLSYYPLRRPTKTAPCGIAVIINYVKFDGTFQPRPQSYCDADALKKLWESFGFKTQIHNDLTAEEVYQVFEKLSKENHSNYDAFVTCYLSHGDEGVVIAKDGKSIRLIELVDLIANGCETLVGKPKLFFVQACQGQGIQTGFGGRTHIPQSAIQHPTLNTQMSTSRDSRNVALRCDVLLFISSIEGFVSYREGNSSWFIDSLVSKLEEFGEELPIRSVLTKVIDEVTNKKGVLNDFITNCKQTPVDYNTLKHELKLKKICNF